MFRDVYNLSERLFPLFYTMPSLFPSHWEVVHIAAAVVKCSPYPAVIILSQPRVCQSTMVPPTPHSYAYLGPTMVIDVIEK